MTRRRRQLRLMVPAALLCAAILAILIANARSTSPSNDPHPAGRTHAARASARLAAADPVLRRRRIGMLPAALQDAAAVSLGGERLVLLGGLDGEDTSTAAITILAAGRAASAGELPAAQHDAQGASLGGEVYVFGGGQFSSYDHILRYEPGSGRVSPVGQLPQPASDVAVTTLGNTAYIVGGYNGEHALDTILAWRPGGAPRIVGRLPEGLRYAAVAATGSRVIVAGGSTETGASRAILSFDPSTGRVTQIGQPARTPHALLCREPRRHGLRDRRPWLLTGIPRPRRSSRSTPPAAVCVTRARSCGRYPTRPSRLSAGTSSSPAGRAPPARRPRSIELTPCRDSSLGDLSGSLQRVREAHRQRVGGREIDTIGVGQVTRPRTGLVGVAVLPDDPVRVRIDRRSRARSCRRSRAHRRWPVAAQVRADRAHRRPSVRSATAAGPSQ